MSQTSKEKITSTFIVAGIALTIGGASTIDKGNMFAGITLSLFGIISIFAARRIISLSVSQDAE